MVVRILMSYSNSFVTIQVQVKSTWLTCVLKVFKLPSAESKHLILSAKYNLKKHQIRHYLLWRSATKVICYIYHSQFIRIDNECQVVYLTHAIFFYLFKHKPTHPLHIIVNIMYDNTITHTHTCITSMISFGEAYYW